jgi:hypothetical protein
MKATELLSMAQAAKEVGITRAGIWYAIKQGLLQAEAHGPYTLIPRSELERYKKHRPAVGRPRQSR